MVDEQDPFGFGGDDFSLYDGADICDLFEIPEVADAVSFDVEIGCEENRCRAFVRFQGSCMIPPDAYSD